MRKISKFLSIVVLGLLVGGCSQGQKAKQTKTKTETKTSQKASGDLAKLSQGRDLFAWTVYWGPSRPFKRKVRTSMPSEPSLLFTMKTRTTNFF